MKQIENYKQELESLCENLKRDTTKVGYLWYSEDSDIILQKCINIAKKEEVNPINAQLKELHHVIAQLINECEDIQANIENLVELGLANIE